MNYSLVTCHLVRALVFVNLFGYTTYFVNKDTPNTGLSFTSLLVIPLLLSIASVVLLYSIKKGHENYTVLSRIYGANVVLSVFTIVLISVAFQSAVIMPYDVWVKVGMPNKPVDGNLSLMLTLFIGISASAYLTKLRW
jgi:hypothetical protein